MENNELESFDPNVFLKSRKQRFSLKFHFSKKENPKKKLCSRIEYSLIIFLGQ